MLLEISSMENETYQRSESRFEFFQFVTERVRHHHTLDVNAIIANNCATNRASNKTFELRFVGRYNDGFGLGVKDMIQNYGASIDKVQ